MGFALTTDKQGLGTGEVGFGLKPGPAKEGPLHVCFPRDVDRNILYPIRTCSSKLFRSSALTRGQMLAKRNPICSALCYQGPGLGGSSKEPPVFRGKSL